MPSTLTSKLPIEAYTSRFITWYVKQFRTAFPETFIDWLTDKGVRSLIIRKNQTDDEIEFSTINRKASTPATHFRIKKSNIKASSLSSELSGHGFDRNSTRLIFEIEEKAFFRRSSIIPSSAKDQIPRLMQMEIERKTPFKIEDVFSCYTLKNSTESPAKILVHQWILRRDLVEGMLFQYALTLEDIDIIQPVSSEKTAPTIELKKRQSDTQYLKKLIIIILSMSAFLLIIGVAVTLWKQEKISADLDEKISSVSAKAAKIREIADRATSESRLLLSLRSERASKHSLVNILDETSKLLPDGSYVTELRLSETRSGQRVIDIIGFSDKAVNLPALFDKSSIFLDAELTAPITPDLTEKRDAFSLQAKLKNAIAKSSQ